MRLLKSIRVRARALVRRHRVEDEMDAELRDHLEREINRNCEAGLSPSDARAAALREFGNVPLIQDQCRDTRRVAVIENSLRDLRYGLRSMRRAPAYTAVAVLSLAVAIGATTAVFSLLDAVLLRPLAVAAPEQLVLIDGRYEAGGSLISYPVYRDLADRQQVFSDVAAAQDFSVSPLRVRVGQASAVRAVRGAKVSGNYFSTLGVVPALGRLIAPADDEPGRAAPVAVISYDFWQRELDGAPSVVGQSMSINERPVTIIGVAPQGFRGFSIDNSFEVWVPLTSSQSDRSLRNRDGTFFRVFGRLKPGLTLQQAQAPMTALFRDLKAAEPQSGAKSPPRADGYRIALQPGDKGFGFFRERLAPTLTVLMALALLLVVIVCMNLTTLFSARASARLREIAVRQALGASRRRLLQQFVTEHVLLAIVGGALGVVFAIWASDVLMGFVATDVAQHSGFNRYVPEGLRFQINLRVLAFAEGVALLAGLCLALVPALVSNRRDLIALLGQRVGRSQDGSLGRIRVPVRQILVVSQVAFSVVLLVGAGLMVRTVANLRGLDAGFDRTNVLLVDLDVRGTGRSGIELIAFERGIHERLNALAGIRSASLSWLSLFSDSDIGYGVMVGGAPPARARVDVVSSGYFETVGMTIAAGRTFTPHDDESAAHVAIVNEAFGRRFFPGEDPIGKRFSVSPALSTAVKEIVGVVKDAKYNDLRKDTVEMFYLPLLQTPVLSARSIQVRTSGPSPALVEQVRQALTDADPGIVITETKTLTDQVDRTLVRERLLASLSAFFGAAAVLLACLGLYSVLAYEVVQRTHEIGVRIALGSPRADVMWLVVRDGLFMVGFGVVLGVPAALALSGVVASQLFGVTPTDPATIATVVTLLLVVAGLAGCLPARRASRVEPIIALTSE